MNESVKFEYAPKDIDETLALMYLNSLDLNGKSPEEIASEYQNAYDKIKAERKRLSKENKPRSSNVQF